MTTETPAHIESGDYCTHCERPLRLWRGIRLQFESNTKVNGEFVDIHHDNYTLCSRDCLQAVLEENYRGLGHIDDVLNATDATGPRDEGDSR